MLALVLCGAAQHLAGDCLSPEPVSAVAPDDRQAAQAERLLAGPAGRRAELGRLLEGGLGAGEVGPRVGKRAERPYASRAASQLVLGERPLGGRAQGGEAFVALAGLGQPEAELAEAAELEVAAPGRRPRACARRRSSIATPASAWAFAAASQAAAASACMPATAKPAPALAWAAAARGQSSCSSSSGGKALRRARPGGARPAFRRVRRRPPRTPVAPRRARRRSAGRRCRAPRGRRGGRARPRLAATAREPA